MATTLAIPTTAEANCAGTQCENSPRFTAFELAHEEVATDGLIVFQTRQGNAELASVEEVLAAIDVRVTAGEDELEGALESDAGFLFWRPTQALPAGAQLSIDVTLDNDALDPDECGLSVLPGELEFELAVLGTAVPALEQPALTFETSLSVDTPLELGSLACCDGAMPELADDGACGYSPQWFEGHCARTDGIGYAEAVFSAPALDPALAASTRLELIVGDEVVQSGLGVELLDDFGFGFADDAVFEASVRIVSLVDGTSFSSELFLVDGGDPDQVGPLELDIDAELDEMCEEPAYICALEDDGEGWDPDACEPIDAEEPEPGGDTDGDPDPETDGDPGPSGDTDGASTEGPGQDDASGGGGCSVGMDGRGSGWMLVLGLAGAPLLRRRRR